MCREKIIERVLGSRMGCAKLAEAASVGNNNNSELTYSYIKSDNKRKEGGGRREERPNEQKMNDHKGDEQVGTRQEER